jgi:hypothetical protein
MVDFNKRLKRDVDPPWWAKIGGKETPQQSETQKHETDSEDSADSETESWLVEETVEYIKKQIQLITETVRKANRVMPRNSGGGSGRQQNGLEYLKTGHLTTDKKLFNILWAGTHEDAGLPNKYNHALVVKVENDTTKVRYLMSLSDNSPVLETMDNDLGKDETQWKGRSVYLFNEVDEITEKKFMRAEVKPPAAASAGKAGGTK